MNVRIVTDSSSDLSQFPLPDLDIAIVPLYINFGEQVSRDGVEMSVDDFYQQLDKQPIHPKTSQPSPMDFARIYQKVAQDADAILSINISSKLSGTVNAARQGIALANVDCPIEVIDSQFVGMALGMIVIETAKAAQQGRDVKELKDIVQQAISRTEYFATLDTLTYLQRGGRIGKAASLLGSLLNIKPILALKNGEIIPVDKVRSHKQALDKLYSMLEAMQPIEQLAIMISTTNLQAYQEFYETVDQRFLGGQHKTYFGKQGPVLGAHVGPGTIALAALKQN